MDFDATATALANRFAAAQVTPPAGGYDNIRVSTADLPGQMTPLPSVFVFVETGEFTTGGGNRRSVHEWPVRFYYNQIGTGGIERDMTALRKWLAVLVDQLRTSVSLSGNVAKATVDGYTVGILTYAGQAYSGIELRVGLTVEEGWSAAA